MLNTDNKKKFFFFINDMLIYFLTIQVCKYSSLKYILTSF